MSTTHQIYCTHCTRGNSALERHQHLSDEDAGTPLGYSVRAGSQSERGLREAFQQIDRMISYQLPSDTPARAVETINAEIAPKRLVYHSSIGNYSMVAHIAYRERDTYGRIGSYFCHAMYVVDDKTDRPWTAVDCLRLWGASNWVLGEDDRLATDLPTVPSLRAFSETHMLTDGLMRSFLCCDDETWDHGMSEVIPERWRVASLQQRQSLFCALMSGLLEDYDGCAGTRLLLVSEPGFAAFLFLILIRSLPVLERFSTMNFSTYEPDPTQLSTELAATTFHDPKNSDLSSELYASSTYCFNTFRDRSSPLRRPLSTYADHVLVILSADGWDGLDSFLRSCVTSGARNTAQLEGLAKVDRTFRSLLSPNATLPDESWRSSKISKEFLRQSAALKFTDARSVKHGLENVAGSPPHLLVIDLIANSVHAGRARGAIRHLLSRIPEDRFGELLQWTTIPMSCKAFAVAHHVRHEGRLPAVCESLLGRVQVLKDTPEILFLSFRGLDAETLDRLYESLANRFPCEFLCVLVRASKESHECMSALSSIVGKISNIQAYELLHCGVLDCPNEYPSDEGQLNLHLLHLAENLGDFPQHFNPMLDLLLTLRDRIPQAHKKLDCWVELRKALRDAQTAWRMSGLTARIPIIRRRWLKRRAGMLAFAAQHAFQERIDRGMTTDRLGTARTLPSRVVVKRLKAITVSSLGVKSVTDVLPARSWKLIDAHLRGLSDFTAAVGGST